ncbi:MAG: hydroxymethylpyrimidine/phosphomethylpyrimidine kinase [Candidatus Coatesbacteria bacterium]|nr:hydroxymethylpyrimidine/phosphomethylpyrimidine kinase [Candidatus Coatesbacteria bacterium]
MKKGKTTGSTELKWRKGERPTEEPRRCVVSIAGFDDTGGAGLLADIKTFSLFQLYGFGVMTAETVQTPDAVLELSRANARRMRRSLETILKFGDIAGVKSGLICDEVTIDVLNSSIKLHYDGLFVIDPVQFSSGGRQILSAQGRQAMVKKLFPLADIITPNLDEAEHITEMQIKTRDDIKTSAERLLQMGPKAVVIKCSGRFGGEDFLLSSKHESFIPAQTELASQLSLPTVHGTGCFYSSALLSLLVLGKRIDVAAEKAKYLTERAILSSMEIDGFKSRLIDHCALRPFIEQCI